MPPYPPPPSLSLSASLLISLPFSLHPRRQWQETIFKTWSPSSSLTRCECLVNKYHVDGDFPVIGLPSWVMWAFVGLRMVWWCIRLTHLTLACEVIRDRGWFKSDKISKRMWVFMEMSVLLTDAYVFLIGRTTMGEWQYLQRMCEGAGLNELVRVRERECVCVCVKEDMRMDWGGRGGGGRREVKRRESVCVCHRGHEDWLRGGGGRREGWKEVRECVCVSKRTWGWIEGRGGEKRGVKRGVCVCVCVKEDMMIDWGGERGENEVRERKKERVCVCGGGGGRGRDIW